VIGNGSVHFRCVSFLLLLGIINLSASMLYAHPFHLCVGQMKWNLDSRVWEVSLRLHPQDLETAMSENLFKQEPSKRVSIDDDGFPDLATKYLGSDFFLRRTSLEMRNEEFKAWLRSTSKPTSNEVLEPVESTLKWIGMERERGWLWIHFEMTQPSVEVETEKLWFVHRLLLATVARQENTIAIDPTEVKKFSLQFRSGEEFHEMKPKK